MKLNLSREWCLAMAHREGDADISAGMALTSTAHPTGAPVAEDCGISPAALETIEIELPEPTDLRGRLLALAVHLESLDSASGEAKLLREAVVVLEAKDEEIQGLEDSIACAWQDYDAK